MWEKIVLRICAVITLVMGVLIALSAPYPELWANISWDMRVFGLGVAISGIGLCFLSMSK